MDRIVAPSRYVVNRGLERRPIAPTHHQDWRTVLLSVVMLVNEQIPANNCARFTDSGPTRDRTARPLAAMGPTMSPATVRKARAHDRRRAHDHRPARPDRRGDRARPSNARVEVIDTQIRLITQSAFGVHSAPTLIALAMLTVTGLRPDSSTRPAETPGDHLYCFIRGSDDCRWRHYSLSDPPGVHDADHCNGPSRRGIRVRYYLPPTSP
jgi:hypothetical protein